jgi:hypothetical protein
MKLINKTKIIKLKIVNFKIGLFVSKYLMILYYKEIQ